MFSIKLHIPLCSNLQLNSLNFEILNIKFDLILKVKTNNIL